MTTTVHTPAATRPSSDAMRRTSLAAGILYLTTFVSVPTLMVFQPVRDGADFVLGVDSAAGVLWGSFASDIAIFFGVIDRVSPFAAVAFIPIAVWEFSLGVYLTVKGFRPAAVAALSSAQAVR